MSSDWVKCPICGEPDMRQEPEGEGVLISCVNLACASNGGNNCSALSIQRELDSAHRLWEREHDELVILREQVKRQAAYDAGRSQRDAEINSLKAELLSALEGLEMECGPSDERAARIAELRKG